MPFCTSCGKEIEKNQKFCDNCGTPVEYAGAPEAPSPPGPASLPSGLSSPPEGPGIQPLAPPVSPEEVPAPPLPASPAADGGAGQVHSASLLKDKKVIIAAAVGLIVIAGVLFMVLPGPGNPAGTGSVLPGFATPTPAATLVPVPTETTPLQTTIPTPTPDPFPDAYPLKAWFEYNEGKYASKATVYRSWINGTYQWHNDNDNKYYTQRPKAGNKYLFVFVTIVNLGTSAYPYPKSNRITVHYNGTIYNIDGSHYLPDKAGERKATAIEVGELEHQSDFFNYERVEDYGYSHGTTSDFVYPGQSNAIDGYLIYEVTESLTPEKTYVEIVFDGDDRAVWKLA